MVQLLCKTLERFLEKLDTISSVQFSSVTQSCPTLCDPWTAAHQASLSITNSQSPPKPMSIKLVMPSNHFILCRPLLLLPSIFPSTRVFSNETLCDPPIPLLGKKPKELKTETQTSICIPMFIAALMTAAKTQK